MVTKPIRDEAANILAEAMLKLRALGSANDNPFAKPDHPRWLENLRDDLWETIRRHLAHSFGERDSFYDPADNGNQGS